VRAAASVVAGELLCHELGPQQTPV